VGCEQRKVDRPNPTLAGEADDANVRVVIDVREEKHRRADKCSDHARAVPRYFAAPDEPVTGKKKDRAG
jgi:hypothetical protein